MRLSSVLTCFFTIVVSALFGQQTINPVIGDSSYLLAFGQLPDENSNEQLRIRTHLMHVEQRLRTADCSGLTAEQCTAREAVLDHLRMYAERGQFPLNTAYENERRPCFIDEKGTICAVGYLVEQTAGRTFAEQINKLHQYDVIADMRLPQLAEWADRNGLTVNECAMIQPAYAYRQQIAVRRSNVGVYAGYTSAFAANDAMRTKPGFEIAALYSHYFHRWIWLQGSVGYVSRNSEVSASGTTFDLRNERWSAALSWGHVPFPKSQWARKFRVKAGVQVDFYDAGSPVLDYDAATGVRNTVLRKDPPEVLVTAELGYVLKPVIRMGHSISVVYLQGTRKTFEGEIGSAGQPGTRYSNRGSYLSVRYTFSLPRAIRKTGK